MAQSERIVRASRSRTTPDEIQEYRIYPCRNICLLSDLRGCDNGWILAKPIRIQNSIPLTYLNVHLGRAVLASRGSLGHVVHAQLVFAEPREFSGNQYDAVL